jgi:hypothetical protein
VRTKTTYECVAEFHKASKRLFEQIALRLKNVCEWIKKQFPNWMLVKFIIFTSMAVSYAILAVDYFIRDETAFCIMDIINTAYFSIFASCTWNKVKGCK